jgi:hypothetical protein
MSVMVSDFVRVQALPAMGVAILDDAVLWHTVAGLNLLTAEVAAGLTSEGSDGGSDETVYCSNHQDVQTRLNLSAPVAVSDAVLTRLFWVCRA